MYVSMYNCICVYMNARMYVCVCICVCMYVCMYVCMCVYLCMCACIYVCMCVGILILIFWIYLRYKCRDTRQDQNLGSKTQDKSKA